MFQPVFVFDSDTPSSCISEDYAMRMGFRLVDIRAVGSTVHGGNPPVIVYDGNGFMTDRVPNGQSRFAPPKCTGVMVMYSPNKGHVHGLADPKGFVEWFFGRSWNNWSHWNSLTGNFRLR
jgi:hypothetical protein